MDLRHEDYLLHHWYHVFCLDDLMMSGRQYWLRQVLEVEVCIISAFIGTKCFVPLANHSGVIGSRKIGTLVEIQKGLAMCTILYFGEGTDSSQSGADGALIIFCMRVRTRDVGTSFGFFKSERPILQAFALLYARQVIDLDVLHGNYTVQNKFNVRQCENYCHTLADKPYCQFFYSQNITSQRMHLSSCIQIESSRETTRQLEAEAYNQPQFNPIEEENCPPQKMIQHRSKDSLSKKIKIRGHHKTEMGQDVPKNNVHSRLKTSPRKEQTPLKSSHANSFCRVASLSKKSKPFQSHWQCPEGEGNAKENMSCSDLMPKKTTVSMSFSRTNHNLRTFSSFMREDDRISSKSKKKIQFTVYEERKKSNSKRNPSSDSKQKEQLSTKPKSKGVPYPYTQKIAFDLFKSDARSRSKSKDASFSREKSRAKESQLHKTLNKSKLTIINGAKIQKAMEKLSKFQIVSDNANSLQIQGMLTGYQLAGEPECKWVLLVIDEVFKKIRKPGAV